MSPERLTDVELVREVAVRGYIATAVRHEMGESTVKNRLSDIYRRWRVRGLAHAALVVGEGKREERTR